MILEIIFRNNFKILFYEILIILILERTLFFFLTFLN